MDSAPVDREAIECLRAVAAEVLRQHTPDREGLCRVSDTLWGGLVLIGQCTHAEGSRWAAHAATAELLGGEGPASPP